MSKRKNIRAEIKMDRLLFLDTETGGLDASKHSLLTIGYAVWESTGDILFKREICQYLNKYITCEEALKINNFNIKNFSPENILSAAEIIDDFEALKRRFFHGAKIPLAGHNIAFDMDFLRAMYRRAGREMEDTFSYKALDTYSILQYLIQLGKIPAKINNSEEAFKYFNIDVKGRHTALGDAVATAELYNKLLKIGV